jgi:hypothetical protein
MQNSGKEIRFAQRKDGEPITPNGFTKRQLTTIKYSITYNKKMQVMLLIEGKFKNIHIS